MRRITGFLLLLLLASVQTARADITAQYHLWGVIGPILKVEVAENGNARVSMRHGTALIRRDNILYHVESDDQGTFLVREEDFRSYHRRVIAEGGLPELPPMQAGDLEIVELGLETVGGREGKVMAVQPRGQPLGEAERKELRQFATVISSDPDLAPVGPLVTSIFGGDLLEGLPGMKDIFAKMREISERGAPIRIGWFLALETTSNEPIPATAFDLPGPVVSGEEAAIRLSGRE